ncbi:MAG: hypothetical protein ACOCVG_05080 [Verrucomicrobiota bacterium]
MKNKVYKSMLVLSTILASVFFAGCGEGGNAQSDRAATASPAELEAIFVAEAPEGAQPVKSVIDAPKQGEAVVVSGQIGGMVEPFGEGYALFMLADESLMFCDETGDMACQTPWDACCEDPEKVKANRLLVQFADASGEVLPHGYGGSMGCKGLTMWWLRARLARSTMRATSSSTASDSTARVSPRRLNSASAV